MFTITKQSAQVAHLNVREEIHGDEHVLALDITVKADVANDFLDQLSPGLRVALYGPAAQSDIDAGHVTVVRFPACKVLDWEGEMKAAALVIHGGRKADNLDFTADINKLVLSLKDGGTVSIKFRAQVLPDPGQVGQLSDVLGEDVKVSVKPLAQPQLAPVE